MAAAKHAGACSSAACRCSIPSPYPKPPTCCGVAQVAARHWRGRLVRLAAGGRLKALALLHKLRWREVGAGQRRRPSAGLRGREDAISSAHDLWSNVACYCFACNRQPACPLTHPTGRSQHLRHVLGARGVICLAPPQAAQRGAQLLEGGTHRTCGRLHLQARKRWTGEGGRCNAHSANSCQVTCRLGSGMVVAEASVMWKWAWGGEGGHGGRWRSEQACKQAAKQSSHLGLKVADLQRQTSGYTERRCSVPIRRAAVPTELYPVNRGCHQQPPIANSSRHPPFRWPARSWWWRTRRSPPW